MKAGLVAGVQDRTSTHVPRWLQQKGIRAVSGWTHCRQNRASRYLPRREAPETHRRRRGGWGGAAASCRFAVAMGAADAWVPPVNAERAVAVHFDDGLGRERRIVVARARHPVRHAGGAVAPFRRPTAQRDLKDAADVVHRGLIAEGTQPAADRRDAVPGSRWPRWAAAGRGGCGGEGSAAPYLPSGVVPV